MLNRPFIPVSEYASFLKKKTINSYALCSLSIAQLIIKDVHMIHDVVRTKLKFSDFH